MATVAWLNATSSSSGIALVGSLGAANVVSSGTNTPAFGQSTTAGNLLIAWLSANAGSTTAPFSSSSSGWNQVNCFGISNLEWTSIWYKANCGAGETAPTFSCSGSPGVYAAQLGEFSGAATSSPLDSDCTSSTSGTAPTATNAASDSLAGDLIVVAGISNAAANPTSVSLLDSNSVSVTANNTHGVSGSTDYSFTYGITTETGSNKDSVTINWTSGVGSCTIASFKT